MTQDLLAPVFEGVENVHFFNGRLLTARDLQDEQAAQRRRHEKFGRLIGAGVVHGLQASLAAPDTPDSLSVTPGLAINELGQCMELQTGLDVSLVRQAGGLSSALPDDAGLFETCTPPTGTRVGTAAGVYLLVISPASRFSEERAPQSGLGGNVVGCGSRYVREGVSFRLVRYDPAALGGLSDETAEELSELLDRGAPSFVERSRLRNLLAHQALGTEELPLRLEAVLLGEASGDPVRGQESRLPRSVRYGALDALRVSGDLGECDVPLALFYWTRRGVAFVDPWAVRRRPVPLDGIVDAWGYVGARRQAETQAAVLQFQQQLAELQADPERSAEDTAQDLFRYLPPTGSVRLGLGAFDLTFFDGLARDVVERLDRAQLPTLLRRASEYPAIDAGEGELIHLFQSLQRSRARRVGDFVVFTTGRMPRFTVSRFNVSRFDASRFDF